MREPGAAPAAEAVTVVDCGGSVCLRVGAGAAARHVSARGRTENYRVASGYKQVTRRVVVRGDESRRRRGRDVDIPWSHGDAAAAT